MDQNWVKIYEVFHQILLYDLATFDFDVRASKNIKKSSTDPHGTEKAI